LVACSGLLFDASMLVHQLLWPDVRSTGLLSALGMGGFHVTPFALLSSPAVSKHPQDADSISHINRCCY
jgi:hypothetical protein